MRDELNKTFSIARFFAILSVITAHVIVDLDLFQSRILQLGGTVGVVIFFVLSGYYYHSQKYDGLLSMYKEKTKSIIVPWIFLGTMTYLYNAIASGFVSIQNYFLWVIGYKTYLYYLTVLVVCYIVFFKRNNKIIIVAIIMNLISVYATAFGGLDNILAFLNVTDYLNVFNWAGYFALGYMMQDISADKIWSFFVKTRLVAIVLFFVLYVAIIALNIRIGYFSFVGMPFQLAGAWAAICMATFKIFNKKLIHSISQMTFSIYLMHLPIVGISDILYNMNIVTKFISPFIVLIICVFALYIGHVVFVNLKIEEIYRLIMGFRFKAADKTDKRL